jgi:hypothetical protein
MLAVTKLGLLACGLVLAVVLGIGGFVAWAS